MPSSPTDRGGKEAADCCHLLTVVLRNVHLLQPHSLDERVNPLGCSGGLSSKGSVAAGISRLPFNRAWTSPPAGTMSFAVLMIDPDGRRGIGSVHWVAYGIPAGRTGLKEGAGGTPTADITLGKNSRGMMGYTGPCGPPISTRRTITSLTSSRWTSNPQPSSPVPIETNCSN